MYSFEELEAWESARVFRKMISETSSEFPSKEQFRLVDQIIRSSRSVCANIAEGYGRFHFQENIQFCRQARGSLSETLDHAICALDEGYIGQDTLNDIRNSHNKTLKILNGYIAYLKKAKDNINSKMP